MTNIHNLFKFLEKKKGTETPLRVKLLYAPDELTDEDLQVKGDLNLKNTPITSLPDNLQVGGSLTLANTKITSLPDNLQVGGSLFIYRTPFTSLPDNLKVGRHLNLSDTKITSLPDNLKIGGNLFLYNNPLGKKYTKEEIRKMVKDTGGYVKGEIYA